MATKYVVRLTEEERQELVAFVSKGQKNAYKIKHANILLSVDADGRNWTDEHTSSAYHCHTNTVANVRRRFVEHGLAAALERKKQLEPSRKRKLDGEGEAQLIALACSHPPAGRSSWTLELLANELVALKVVDSICPQTVRRTLKKTNSNHTCVRVG
jgi:transposase